MTFQDDTRGVSIALNHALSVGITALLISGLMIGAGQMIEDQQERVTRSGLHNVGNQLVTELSRVDRIATSGARDDVRSRVPFSAQIAGNGYTIDLQSDAGGGATLYANSTGVDVTVPIEIDTESAVCERQVNGGPVAVVYDTDRDCLTIDSSNR